MEEFLSLTGCTDLETAKFVFHEAALGDLGTAVSLYLADDRDVKRGKRDREENCDPRGNVKKKSPPNTKEPRDPFDDSPIRTPDPSFTSQLISSKTNALDVKQTLPIETTVNSMVSCSDASDVGEKAFSDLFAPPTASMTIGPFEQVKNKGCVEGKWLLTNIQSTGSFSSHALNRDIWRDEIIVELLQQHFIFWQAESTSSEALLYCQLYNVTQLPHIAVINPRTGQMVQEWRYKKFEAAGDAQAYLLDFIESNDAKRKKVGEAGAGSSCGKKVFSLEYENGECAPLQDKEASRGNSAPQEKNDTPLRQPRRSSVKGADDKNKKMGRIVKPTESRKDRIFPGLGTVQKEDGAETRSHADGGTPPNNDTNNNPYEMMNSNLAELHQLRLNRKTR